MIAIFCDMDTQVERFNLRVYGLLISQGRVLVSQENRGGFVMVKFPGGGLEFGEGLSDCLVREFKEELNISITVGDFYYTNEFLQISAFNEKDQLISFYFNVSTHQLEEIPISSFTGPVEGQQFFNWIALADLNAEQFTFPVDQAVAQLLAKSSFLTQSFNNLPLDLAIKLLWSHSSPAKIS